MMGDFNTIMAKEDRVGGNEVQGSDVRELNSLMEDCELHELKSVGHYFSWTNRSIYSQIDHVFTNAFWFDVFDYTHSQYMSSGLSDHTPIKLEFSTSPKSSSSFQYCDIWSTHPAFPSIIASITPPASHTPLLALYHYLDQLRPKLRKLNKDNFADLGEQQKQARLVLERI